MNKIIDLVGKFSGFNFVWDRLDGYKTYLAAAAGILTGLGGLGQEVLVVINAHSWSAAFAFIKQLPQDQSWLLVVTGLFALGIGHKIEKQNEPVQPQ